MASFDKHDFCGLINLICLEQNVTVSFECKDNYYRILQDNIPNGKKDAYGTVDIVFRIKNNDLIISNLFLKSTNKGTGSLIIRWFMDFCKNKNLEKILIRIVSKSNVPMNKLCNKFSFYEIENDSEFDDYMLVL